MKNLKLYYSPGACSLAAHLVLEELELPHTLVRVATGDDQHREPQYLAKNPVGLVPLLEMDDLRVTETTAILRFLARQRPARAMYPSDSVLALRCDELLSQLSSLAHPYYRFIVRPDRLIGARDISPSGLREVGKERFIAALTHVESRLPESGYIFSSYSIADAYVSCFWLWARYANIDVGRWPRISSIAREALRRPASRRTMVAESLVNAAGEATPPARV